MKKELKVLNTLGLHARPAARFVQCAIGFRSSVTVWSRGEAFNGQSIIELLLANLDQGAVFTLETEGPDEEEAIRELERLLGELIDEDR